MTDLTDEEWEAEYEAALKIADLFGLPDEEETPAE